MFRRCAVLLAGVALSACMSLDPAYKRPAAPIPREWRSGPAFVSDKATVTAADVPWRHFVKDEKL